MTDQPTSIRLSDLFRGVCPHCKVGKFYRGFFAVNRRCPNCQYNFYPESGFFLGAMMVSYLLTAALTIPFVIVLKLSGASMTTLMVAPLVWYAFLGTFLLHYARLIWIYLEYRMTARLDGVKSKHRP